MRREPIDKIITIDLTDEVAMAKLRKVLDRMRNCDDPDPYSEKSVELKEKLYFDTLREIAINNPQNWQPHKYQRKGGRRADGRDQTNLDDGEELPF